MGRRHKLGLKTKIKLRQMVCAHVWRECVPVTELEHKVANANHVVWKCGACGLRSFRRPGNPPWQPVRRKRVT